MGNPISGIDPDGMQTIQARLAVAIARGNVAALQTLIASEALTPEEAQRAAQAIARLQSTASQIIAAECKASVRGQFPGEFLDETLASIQEIASQGNAAARTAMKLLNDSRFKK